MNKPEILAELRSLKETFNAGAERAGAMNVLKSWLVDGKTAKKDYATCRDHVGTAVRAIQQGELRRADDNLACAETYCVAAGAVAPYLFAFANDFERNGKVHADRVKKLRQALL